MPTAKSKFSKYRKRKPKSFKRYRNMKVKKSPYNATTYYFKRKCKLISLNTNSGGYLSNTFIFGLNQLPNYTEFTTLGDQFCIRYIKLYAVYRGTTLSMIESANNSYIGYPNLICVRDYDDDSIPTPSETGYNELREYNKSKTFTFTAEKRCFQIGLTPAIRTEAYRSLTTSSYVPKFKQYIDCDTPDTPHYGLKMVIQTPSISALNTPISYYDFYATFYIALKNVR